MDELKLELYWNEIPTDKNDPITYNELCVLWNKSEREVRKILHLLSSFDNGDNYILVRSGRKKGFYRTDNIEEMQEFKSECLQKGRSIFAPVKKINRILNSDFTQYKLENNMRLIREEKGLKQAEVCIAMQQYDRAIDKAMLSKMENGICLPTPYQLGKFAHIYGCQPSELINANLFYD